MSRRTAGLTGIAAGYAIGSIPVGVWLVRLRRNLDVRDFGSGGSGTTNVLRVLGPAAAGATFALDVSKGAGAVAVARRIGAGPEGEAAAGLASLVGHSWPLFAHFRGGKSVATAFGGLLMLSPAASVGAVGGGLSALGLSRIVSVGSLAAASSATAVSAVVVVRPGGARRRAALGFAAPATALIAWRHAPNLRRLLAGTEPRVSLRRARSAATSRVTKRSPAPANAESDGTGA